MEISGKITHVLPVITGEGKNGTWKKGGYVLEVPGQYPKSVAFDIWGDNIEAYNLKQGEDVNVWIDIESREYNDKWFTNVKAWKVDKGSKNDSTPNVEGSSPNVEEFSRPDEDDLPF